jgi:hypothetical protein
MVAWPGLRGRLGESASPEPERYSRPGNVLGVSELPLIPPRLVPPAGAEAAVRASSPGRGSALRPLLGALLMADLALAPMDVDAGQGHGTSGPVIQVNIKTLNSTNFSLDVPIDIVVRDLKSRVKVRGPPGSLASLMASR